MSKQLWKRENLFATYASVDTERVRELVRYRARIDTIKALVPRPNIALAARTAYEAVDQRSPGGSKPLARKVNSTFTSLANRLDLNTMCAEFVDLRHAGFTFEDSLVAIYRSYRKRIDRIDLEDMREASLVISFDHVYVMVLDLELTHSRMIRCTSCGTRSLLLPHVSILASKCVFCDLLAVSKKRNQPRRPASVAAAA